MDIIVVSNSTLDRQKLNIISIYIAYFIN